MVTILRNLKGMTVYDVPPSTYNNLTDSTAVSTIKYYRNRIVHSSTGQLSNNEFNIIFDEIVEVILYIYCMLVREIWKCIHPWVSYSMRVNKFSYFLNLHAINVLLYQMKLRKHIHVKYCYFKSIGTLSQTFKKTFLPLLRHFNPAEPSGGKICNPLED